MAFGHRSYDDDDYDDNVDYDLEDDGFEDDDLDMLDDADYFEEKKLRRAGRFRVAAGVMDFVGVIAGAVAVLVLIALLISLVNWLIGDISNMLTSFQSGI